MALLLTTAVPSYGGAITDSFQSIAEQAWMNQYIPRSDEETLPLTDYDNFEVTELFRAETIEDLEASLTDGYPMPWLEEVLKDTTIPWEDRYWLDCRVRASIAQNTHTFFNPAGNPVHIDADAVFPGELYWREHMIVDPAGWNAPEGMPRPANLDSWDIGYLMNLFGRNVGSLAIALPPMFMSISRDASVGVLPSGGNSVYHPDRQPYACFLAPDGSFEETPLRNTGRYDVALSADGTVAAFSFIRDHVRSEDGPTQHDADIELFTGSGELFRIIDTISNLDDFGEGAITQDGHFFCHKSNGVNICLVNCETGESTILEKPAWDQNTFRARFSPDGSSLALSGATTDRIVILETLEQTTLPFITLRNSSSSYSSYACASSTGITSSIVYSGAGASFHRYLVIAKDSAIRYSEEILAYIHTYPLEAEFSPDGFLLLINPIDAATGAPSPFVGAPPDAYNLPLIVMQIEGR